MNIDHLAFDIETVPAKEISDYSPLVQEKIGEKVARIQERNPDYNYDQFASIHGDFNKIICISMGYIINEATSAGKILKVKLKSFSGDDERETLSEFNEVIRSFNGIFIHYNGLNFDAITIIQRMAHHNMTASNKRFTNLRRYTPEPHFDVMMQYYNWDLQRALPLGVLAELHQIPSPKDDLSGDKVLGAYRNGEWKRIVHYCEFDVATTLNLWNKIFRSQAIIPPENYEFSE